MFSMWLNVSGAIMMKVGKGSAEGAGYKAAFGRTPSAAKKNAAPKGTAW